MYHIGICDDDSVFVEYIKRIFGTVCTDIKFYEYLSGEELIKDMQTREKYDLLILDVVMPGMDGNETAKEFRKQFPDTLLVFCSGVCRPTVESFETNPYRYWLKEYTEDRMFHEVNEILDRLKKTSVMPYIIGKRENQLVRLSLDNVLYIAIAKRGSVIYCKNSKETYTSRKKLAEFYEELKDFGFIYFIGKFSFRRTLEKRNTRGSGHGKIDGIDLKDIKAFFTDIVIVKFLVKEVIHV